MRHSIRILAAASLATMLGACGHDRDADDDSKPGSGPAAQFAQQCAPNNPFTADALEPTSRRSLDREKQWVSAYLEAVYLWRDEIPDVDPAQDRFSDNSDVVGSLYRYFNALRTPAITASGKPKDQFSFIYPTRLWNELSQEGSELGYGMQLQFNSTPPVDMRVVYVEPDSPAAIAGIARGLRVLFVDGASTESASAEDAYIVNAGLLPAASGERHQFIFEGDDGNSYARTLTAADIRKAPVPLADVRQSGGRAVGYLLFNDHLATAEEPLIDAITLLRDAGAQDLVLDLRYNGGGYLYIASELAYMIAGPNRTNGKDFERLQFNARRADDNSVFPFLSCSGTDETDCAGKPALPTLNLSRVYVIATDATCSASESIINSLRGVDVDVRLIGSRTCGKPYGFTARDNCGISYFPIEFQGVNAKGFGNYADGFAPDCSVGDDLGHELGDPQEGMLSAALGLQAGNGCGIAKALAPSVPLQRSPLRENRLLRSR